MKYYRLIILAILMVFVLFSYLHAEDRTPEWYEEEGIAPDTEAGEIQLNGQRTLRQIPEGGILLIPDSSPKRVMGFDPITGDLIDADFIPPHPQQLTTPIHMILCGEGTSLMLSDQSQNTVQRFSFDGQYEGVFAPPGGANTSIMQNIRGMFLRDDGHYLVTVAGGANAHCIAEFDSQGAYVGNFVANNAGGIAHPWSILFRQTENDYLISASGTNAIHRFDVNGNHLEIFAGQLNFPQQLQQLPNGNILVATFSNPSGVYELDSQGNQIGYYNPVTGLRGVYELGNGNLLVTNSSGVYEINRQGVLVDTKIAGVNARHITYVGPSLGYGLPFEEDFETGSLPEDWEQEFVDGEIDWTFQSGGHLGNPPDAFEGDYNAFFRSDTVGNSTLLVTPPLLIADAINPVLKFHHAQAAWGTSQDELHVYYRIGDDDWILLESYDENVPEWTERTITLPEQENPYYIGFEALSGGGYGVCLDLVKVFDHVFPIMEVTPLEFNVVLTEGDSTVEVLTVSNVGTADLEYEIAFSAPAEWLTVSESTGIVPPAEEVEIDLLIETDGLTGGEDYTVTLIVSDDYFGMEVNVVVNLHVEQLILNPPQNLTGEMIVDEEVVSVELQWEAPDALNRRINGSRNLVGYNVYRQDSPEDDFELINPQVVLELFYLDEDLLPGIYSYYVTALYTQGESEATNTVTIQVPEQVAQPAASPEPGEYEDSVLVELTCETPEALIYYTLNGEDPDEESLLYEEPIMLLEDTVIKARAYKDGYFPSDILIVEYFIVVSVDDVVEPIAVTRLHKAYPNPFNPNTTIAFSLAEPGDVTLEIFNVKGQKVETLLREWKERGTYQVIWNGKDSRGRDAGSGIYFYRMTVNEYVSVRKMMMIQ